MSQPFFKIILCRVYVKHDIYTKLEKTRVTSSKQKYILFLKCSDSTVHILSKDTTETLAVEADGQGDSYAPKPFYVMNFYIIYEYIYLIKPE